MSTIAIIPARYGSSRFPGKPLAMIGGRSMIEHVWRAASDAVDRVVVATDDGRIADVVEGFGGEAVMTSVNCANGTERVAEAYAKVGNGEDIVVNVQGDEPTIQPAHIASVAEALKAKDIAQIATLALEFDPAEGLERLSDPNRVKLVRDREGMALYFSRSIVPYLRDVPWQEWHRRAKFYIHIGLYAFRANLLHELVELPQSPLEQAEKLEQLRWLGHGYHIATAVTTTPTHPVDTPEDLQALLCSR